MGEDVEDFRVEGIRPPDFQEILQVDGTSDTTDHRIIMGDVTSDWEDPGWFPPQGGLTDVKDSYEE